MSAFPFSFAMLCVPTDCASGCRHDYCEEIRVSATRQVCAGCGGSIGLNRAYRVHGCAAHLSCMAYVLCKVVGGASRCEVAPAEVPLAQSSSGGGPTPHVDVPDLRDVERCAPASPLRQSQAVA